MQSQRTVFALRACLCAAVGCLSIHPVGAQSASLGSISGVVTAIGAKRDTIRVANAVVQLWGTDALTTALRDSACAAWLADKPSWTQAKEELESPSGMKLAGTPVGRDVDLLTSLLARRRDTTHTGADGTFSFGNLPIGPYTVEAEMYANDKFLQWSKDVAVMPRAAQRVDLDARSVGEDQYCTMSSRGADSAMVYDAKDLDQPLRPLGHLTLDRYDIPFVPNGSLAFAFVIDERGIPDPASVRMEHANVAVSAADLRRMVADMRFEPPTVHGRPVKARVQFGIGMELASH